MATGLNTTIASDAMNIIIAGEFLQFGTMRRPLDDDYCIGCIGAAAGRRLCPLLVYHSNGVQK